MLVPSSCEGGQEGGGQAEMPLLARLNLSLAAAQSIFAAFGMLFVNYLRRSSPKKFPVQGS